MIHSTHLNAAGDVLAASRSAVAARTAAVWDDDGARLDDANFRGGVVRTPGDPPLCENERHVGHTEWVTP